MKQSNADDEEKPSRKPMEMDLGKVSYPFLAYGNDSLLKAETVLIKNATVWTNEEEGIIENGQVLIQDGKIKAVGASLNLDEIF